MDGLPTAIADLAYRSSSGELAWRREDVPAALAAIVESRQATLGGEVWVALGEGRWHGMIPAAEGGSPGVWTWETAPRAEGENWFAYCARTADECARAVERLRVEDESAVSVRDQLCFNIAFVMEDAASP